MMEAIEKLARPDENQGDLGSTLSWKSLPIIDDLPKSVLAPLALVVFPCLTFLAGFGLYLSLLSLVVLLVSLMKYFATTTFELTDSGVKTKFLWLKKNKPWSSFKNYYKHDVGIFLSTLEKPGALDGFRGLLLRFSNNRNQVLEYVSGKFERKT